MSGPFLFMGLEEQAKCEDERMCKQPSVTMHILLGVPLGLKRDR